MSDAGSVVPDGLEGTRVEDCGCRGAGEGSQRKKRRNVAIHDHTIVRTYNFSRGIVHDHRAGKEASVKDVLGKGKLEKLR